MDLLQRISERANLLDVRLFEVGGTAVSLMTLVTVLILVGVSFLAARIAERAMARVLRRRDVRGMGSVAATARLVRYTVLTVGLGVAVETLGVDLSTLFAAGAILAVAAGLAMQEIAQNFVAGVILLAERSIKPDDVLEVSGEAVRVQRMGPRATVARTRDEEEIILPNSLLVRESVVNYTFRDSLYRLRAQVGVVYGSDMARVREVLETAAARIEWRLDVRDPLVLLTGFGNSSVDFDVSVWIDDPWLAPQRRSQLYDAIWWSLEEAGIVIAFPQLDLHLDPPVTDSLRALARSG